MNKQLVLIEAITQMYEGVPFELEDGREYYFNEVGDLCCRASGHDTISGVSLNVFATLCYLDAVRRRGC